MTDPTVVTKMVRNTTRDMLRQDILTAMGAPIVKIEVTTEQMDNAINQALKFFWKYHRDGAFENYYIYTLTEQDAAFGTLPAPQYIDAVIEILPKGFTPSSANFATMEWQMTAGAMSTASGSSGAMTSPAGGVGGTAGGNTYVNPGFSQISMSDYVLAKQNLDFIKTVTGQNLRIFDFAKYQRKVYLRFPVKAGDIIVMRVSQNLDPENPDIPECNTVWDDEWIKTYAQAIITVTWGMVLRKYGGIQLPGGVILDGQTLIDEGNAQIKESEDFIKTEQPMDFFLG